MISISRIKQGVTFLQNIKKNQSFFLLTKKILKAVFFLLLFQIILLFPLAASAGSYYACVVDPATNKCSGPLRRVTYEGQVPMLR